MKKLLGLFTLTLFAFAIVGCDGDTTTATTEGTTQTTTEAPMEWNIVMLTDVGTITDESFNQGTWEGVKAFAEENDIPHMYFRPNSGTQADYEEAIDLVVANGANVIVTPGYLFETAIYTKQFDYPDVYFILIDGEPHTPDYSTYETTDNTTCILFKEEQSGFLAGYAAVADGFTNLGFMGGMEVPAVQRFGMGYVAGAFYAAEELSKTITFDANRYAYLGNFDAEPAHVTEATGWFDAGVEVIFAAAGGAGTSVMLAAENTDSKVIGVDVDQSYISDTVISSAMKQLAVAVQQELTAIIIDGAGNGGNTLVKGASEDAVGLPIGDSWGFTTFTETEYEALFALIENGTIVVPASEADLATFLETECGDPDADALVAKTES
jgi:basic membrane protein A and related proteins